MTELPREEVQQHLPPALNTSGNTGLTANLGYYAFECDRVVAAPHVFTDVSLFMTWAFVEPKNATWSPDGAQRFVFDFIVNGIDLRFPETAEGAFERSKTPLSESWIVKTNAIEFAFESLVTNDHLQHYETPNAFWFRHPDGQLLRVDSDESDSYDQLQLTPGTIRLQGTGASHDVFGDQAAMLQGGFATHMKWTVDPTYIFPEGN